MAMTDWSTTNSSNGTSLGINIAENCPAANVNNALREIMAQTRATITTNALAVSGNASVGGTFSVTGNMTFSAGLSGAGLTLSANASVGGTLGVTGAATLSSTLAVTGAGTFSSTLAVTGNASFGGTLATVGNISGPNFVIAGQATSDAGTFGFTNSNGSAVVVWGTAAAGSGAIELRTAGTTKFSISNAGNATLSGTLVVGGSQVLINSNLLLQFDGTDAYIRSQSGHAYFGANGANYLKITSAGVLQEAVSGLELGYKDVPQNAQSGDYTLVLTDRGKEAYMTGSGKTLTIPPNSSVAFPIGTTIPWCNDGGGNLTIAPGSGVTLVWAGVGSTGSRTAANTGQGYLSKKGTNRWFVGGVGLS